MDKQQEALILELFEIGAIQFGSFTLKGGVPSPIYVDLRRIISYPSLLKKISTLLWEKVGPLSFDLICGVPYAALPLATWMALEHDIAMIMCRKEVKDYGTKKKIEGVFKRGQRCLIIEDVITSGASIFDTIDPLQHEGLVVADIAIILNREQGGKEILEKKGFHVHSLLTLSELLRSLRSAEKISEETFFQVEAFFRKN